MMTQPPAVRPSTVAVIGAGALGCLLAAHLQRVGHLVTIAARRAIPELVVVSSVSGDRLTTVVPVVTDPTDADAHDWTLVTTKAQDTASARRWVDAFGGTGGRVVVLQNGIEHLAHFPDLADRTVPAIATISARRIREGWVQHLSGDSLVLDARPGAHALADLFAGTAVRASVVDDFVTQMWRKLLANVCANPITALTLRTCEVLNEPGVQELVDALLVETIEVGRRCGAAISQDDHFAVKQFWRDLPPGNGTSMLDDRLAGRPLEVEFLNGAVVRAAQRIGMTAPANELLLGLMRALGPLPNPRHQ